MAAQNVDIHLDQGATLTRFFQINSGQNPLNLTGHTFRGSIRKFISDAEPVASFVFDLGNQGVNPGYVIMQLTAASSKAIALKAQKTTTRVEEAFAYDVEHIKPTGEVNRILQGQCFISPGVTA